MDTTETYIKMCEKAVEIQAMRRGGMLAVGQTGDWWAIPKIQGYEILCLGSVYNKLLFRYDSYLWLPRQDELQAMMTEYNGPLKLLDNFNEFVFGPEIAGERMRNQWEDYVSQFASMEQLWLAFVMRERCHKTWNGENWVTIL